MQYSSVLLLDYTRAELGLRYSSQMLMSHNVEGGHENGWKFEHALKGREMGSVVSQENH